MLILFRGNIVILKPIFASRNAFNNGPVWTLVSIKHLNHATTVRIPRKWNFICVESYHGNL